MYGFALSLGTVLTVRRKPAANGVRHLHGVLFIWDACITAKYREINVNRQDQALQAFYNAQLMAYWSLVGLVVPVVGIILGGMSLSKLNQLSPSSDDEYDDIRRAKKFAGWGVALSIITVLVVFSLWLWFTYRADQKIRQADQTIQQSAQDAETYTKQLNEIMQ